MRNLPPKATAGLTQLLINCISRVPRPPAMTNASVPRAKRLTKRVSRLISARETKPFAPA